MSHSQTLTRTVSAGGNTITSAVSATAEGETFLDVSVADAQTDQEHVFTVDVSQVKAFYLLSDQAVTIETNSGAAPDETMVLAAGHAYAWIYGDSDAFAFAVDITKIYITNASGSTARVQAAVLYDSTP